MAIGLGLVGLAKPGSISGCRALQGVAEGCVRGFGIWGSKTIERVF